MESLIKVVSFDVLYLHIWEFNEKEALDEEDYPLRSMQARITLSLDYGQLDVPRKASRKAALEALRRIVDAMEAHDLNPVVTERTPAPELIIEAPEPREPVDYGSRLTTREEAWRKPNDLDMRLIKSAHRLIHEVSRRSEGGRAVLAAELVGSAGLSAPTVSRLLKEDEPVAQYLDRFIRITPHGRTKAIDLTPEGRVMASKIRAQVIPS